MLDAIIRLSLRYRALVVMGSLGVLLYGAVQATQLPVDVFPDLDRPRVAVLTECPGLAAEEVETLVSQPIESALLGATGVRAVRSQSSASLSVVHAEFDWDVDVWRARQTVQERLSGLGGSLPANVRPQMAPTSSIMGQILHVGLTSKDGKTSPRELNTIANWDVRRRLLQVPGVAEVIVQGGERKQYQVLVDADALQEFNVSYQQVETAVRNANQNGTGGFAVQGDSEKPIRIFGRLGPRPERVLADLRKVPVAVTPKRTILLEQVARVAEGSDVKRGDAGVDGEAAVVVTVAKQPHADTRRVTTEVFAALDEIAPGLPADVRVSTELFRLKGFIDRGVWNVGEALVVGAVLVLVVLTVFLLNVRTTFITLTAIPLSLAMTVLAFRLIGKVTGEELSINVMTLGGIAVAMGELVDDAIVDVENIFRRLRENNALPLAPASPDPVPDPDPDSSRHPSLAGAGDNRDRNRERDRDRERDRYKRPVLRVVYDASREVRGAIVFGTIVVVLVFLPLFALSGVEGRLFTPLGIAYVVSILASLLTSLTLTPVLSYYLLGRAPSTHHTHDGWLLRALKWLARPLVQFSMSYAGTLLLLGWIAVVVAGVVLSRLGADFLPAFDEGSVQVNVALPPGGSLQASNRACAIVDKKLNTLRKSDEAPDAPVLHFFRRTGRAERDEHAMPVTETEYLLSMNPDSPLRREEALAKLLADLKEELPGADVEVEQPLSHMMSHMLSGVSAQVAIKVYGDDLDRLRRVAEQIKAVLAQVKGVTAPVIEAQAMTDELHVRLRADDLAFHGLSRAGAAALLESALAGEVVSQVVEGQKRFDLLVRLDEPYRTDYARLGALRIDLPEGRGQVPLREIADVGDDVGPNGVNRDNARRRMVIRCNVSGRDLGGAATEIERRVRKQVELPAGYYVEYGGVFESQRRATLLIAVLALLSVVGTFAVLLVLFPSVRIVLQVLNALPTAFVGGVIALALTNQTLTVAALVGFVSLGGIAVRNGILLMSHYVHLMREEGERFTPEMVMRGSLERLSPVLMTALTAGIALVPLVLGGTQPGREVLYPVATVILGGLVSSTFCEFLIHPGLFWRFSGADAARLASAGDDEETSLKEERP